MYHILKLLCNISPKIRDFLEKKFFCLINLTCDEGALVFKIANFEIIILKKKQK